MIHSCRGDTEQDCQSAVMATCQVLDSLGVTVHPVNLSYNPLKELISGVLVGFDQHDCFFD